MGLFRSKVSVEGDCKGGKDNAGGKTGGDKGYVGFSGAEVWEARDSVALVTMVDKWATGNQSASMRNE